MQFFLQNVFIDSFDNPFHPNTWVLCLLDATFPYSAFKHNAMIDSLIDILCKQEKTIPEQSLSIKRKRHVPALPHNPLSNPGLW